MRAALRQLIDRFVPAGADRETARRYRVVTAFLMSGAVILVPVALLSMAGNHPYMAGPIAFVWLVFVLLLEWLRRGGSPRLGLNVVLGICLVVILMAGVKPGGTDEEALGWLIVGAAASVVLAGNRDGIAWAGAFVIANIAGSPLIPHWEGYAPESIVDSADRAMACLLAAMLTWHVEAARRRATLELEEESAVAERRRAELAEVVAKLDAVQDHAVRAQRLRSVGQLAAGVAHEVNTPAQYALDNIRFLSTFALELRDAAELAHAALDDPTRRQVAMAALEALALPTLADDLRGATADATRGLDRIREIVADLTTFAEGSGDARQQLDLNRQVELTVKTTRGVWAPVAQLDLQLGKMPTIPGCVGDLRQVIVSLIANAAAAVRDARRRPGHITIRTSVEGDHAVLRVTDDGVGMPPEVMERAFDPFFTTRPVGAGTGTGLSVAWRVAEEHGGDISVTSTVDLGSTFTLRLPLMAPVAVSA